jgi:hypothetical protein
MPADKKLHFWAGLVLALLVGILTNPAAGLVAAVVAGAAKEIYDATGAGTADELDFAATAAGGLTGSLALLIFMGVL